MIDFTDKLCCITGIPRAHNQFDGGEHKTHIVPEDIETIDQLAEYIGYFSPKSIYHVEKVMDGILDRPYWKLSVLL